MKSKFFLFLSLAALLLCVACGGSSGPSPSGNFSNATLSGQYTYQLNGIDNAYGAFRESGVFTADGAGHITAGTDDLFAGASLLSGSTTGSYSISNDGTGSITLNVGNGRTLDLAITAVTSSKVYLMVVDAGTVATAINTSFTGSYAVDSLGRADITIAPSGGSSFHDVAWLVSPSRALFLVDSADVEDGTIDLQTVSSFSNTTMVGQFGLLMHGYSVTANQTYDRVGTLQWDGAGHLTLNEAVNVGGTASVPGFLGGSYSVSSNGRATGSINSLSSNLVFYLISGSDAYVLQNDAGIEIDGIVSKQQ